MNIVPSLDELARDPNLLQGLDAKTLATIALKANTVAGMVAAQLEIVLFTDGATADVPTSSSRDRLLVIKEAAAKLAVTEDYLSGARICPFG